MEEENATIARAATFLTYRAPFMLVAAMNPCWNMPTDSINPTREVLDRFLGFDMSFRS